MNKYFKRQLSLFQSETISSDEIIMYKEQLIVAMKKIGASDQELNLIHDATIRNSIRSKRKPEDVAWAILQ